jgi:hypothetical protein
MGLGLAFKCFWKALTDPEFAAKASGLLLQEPSKPSGKEISLLGILQRDGRLVDFLMEDVAGYSDEQIGAAVRDIHRNCRGVLEKYVSLAPVIDAPDESTVEVPAGFNASTIRLTGHVKGTAPYKGTLMHRGWKVTRVDLPEVTAGADPMTLAPAEVEIE